MIFGMWVHDHKAVCREEAEEVEEKIRLKQYVSLRSKGRHDNIILQIMLHV
jgi:hypothetical protein